MVPGPLFTLYGVSLDGSGIMLAHVAGAAVFALGLLAWLFRRSESSEANRMAATALFGFFLPKTIVTVLAQLDGVFNGLGWSIVLLDAGFLLAYGYRLFVKR